MAEIHTPFGSPVPGFEPGVSPPDEISETCWWLLFCGSRLLVTPLETGGFQPLQSDECPPLPLVSPAIYLGRLNGQDCFCATVARDSMLAGKLCMLGLHEADEHLSPSWVTLGGRSIQLLSWERNHRFCGVCGNELFRSRHQFFKECPQCHHKVYPRISPVVMVLIHRHQQLLLARAARFPAGRFSILAGFVEAGETLEQCVHREVMEEVGLKVEDLRYADSQPWPFPHSLMIGFFARYRSGDIHPDGHEIVEAHWFNKNHLPELPPSISLARWMIERFINTRSHT